MGQALRTSEVRARSGSSRGLEQALMPAPRRPKQTASPVKPNLCNGFRDVRFDLCARAIRTSCRALVNPDWPERTSRASNASILTRSVSVNRTFRFVARTDVACMTIPAYGECGVASALRHSKDDARSCRTHELRIEASLMLRCDSRATAARRCGRVDARAFASDASPKALGVRAQGPGSRYRARVRWRGCIAGDVVAALLP